MQYTLVGTEDGSNITVFVPGRAPLVAHSTHPNFDAIVEKVMAKDDTVVTLFDAAKTAVDKFERLTERVTTANGKLYLDGEEVDNSLASQVVRFIKDGVEDWKPLVNFFENVLANENEHSREQLYTWLAARDFTITPDGLIVGYKGVQKQADGSYVSIFTGSATVDGKSHTGHIPNTIGSVVEMPRNTVVHDPYNGCSVGLHVGTHEYANGFARGAVLEVHVNPRDVVSVPTENAWAKMRTCRYKVIGIIDTPYTAPVATDYGDGSLDCGCDPEDHCDCEDYCEDCGLNIDNGCECVEPLEPVKDLEEDEKDPPVFAGDVFESKDARRKGTYFTVDSIAGDYAVGRSGQRTKKGKKSGKALDPQLVRKVKLDRLLSYRYKKVS